MEVVKSYKPLVGVIFAVQFALMAGCDSAKVAPDGNDTAQVENGPTAGSQIPIGAAQSSTTLPESSPVQTPVTAPVETSPAEITAQAIDGYIVGGDVFCDGQMVGLTTAGGWLACPFGTSLISVVGGQDVGFDVSATDGGTVFMGTLQAPGDARYVTPLTSLATKMASTNGVFDKSKYIDSVNVIGDRLNIAGLDLNNSPVNDVVLARVNTQLNLLVSQFATTTDDYALAMQAVGDLFVENAAINLTDSAASISALNEVLISSAPHLALEPAAQVDVTDSIEPVVTGVETAPSVADIDEVVEELQVAPVAFSIDRLASVFSFSAYHATYYGPDRQYSQYYDIDSYSLADFEAKNISLKVDGWERHVGFYASAFTVERTVVDASVDVAVDIESVSDDRRLSVTVKGVKISMQEGDFRSIEINTPQQAVMNARYIDLNGVVTDVSENADEDLIASSENRFFSINLERVENVLHKNGYSSFLREVGDYRVTMVIDGINFHITDTGVVRQPSVFTVDTAYESISGLGLQGYVSLIPGEQPNTVPDTTSTGLPDTDYTDYPDVSYPDISYPDYPAPVDATPDVPAPSPEGSNNIVDEAANVGCEAGSAEFRVAMLESINASRREARMCGTSEHAPVSVVGWNESLSEAALAHANDMTSSNFFSHSGSDGSSVSNRADTVGYPWRAIGENIAAGQLDVAEVHNGWLNSPGHCRNIMNNLYSEVGAACVSDSGTDFGTYWVVVFGSSR